MILRRLVVLEDTLHHLFDAEDPRILAMMEGVIHPKNIQFAAVVIVLVPIVVMFPYAQRYFMKGLIVGSLKG